MASKVKNNNKGQKSEYEQDGGGCKIVMRGQTSRHERQKCHIVKCEKSQCFVTNLRIFDKNATVQRGLTICLWKENDKFAYI